VLTTVGLKTWSGIRTVAHKSSLPVSHIADLALRVFDVIALADTYNAITVIAPDCEQDILTLLGVVHGWNRRPSLLKAFS
jgi:hypothetical protein